MSLIDISSNIKEQKSSFNLLEVESLELFVLIENKLLEKHLVLGYTFPPPTFAGIRWWPPVYNLAIIYCKV